VPEASFSDLFGYVISQTESILLLLALAHPSTAREKTNLKHQSSVLLTRPIFKAGGTV
jgi:hypothetical protein